MTDLTYECSSIDSMPPQYVANAILYQLAEVLGYETEQRPTAWIDESGAPLTVTTIVVDSVQEVLDDALETIWRYKELES